MKFIVSSSSLLKHLQQISGVINANTVLPILEDFLFEIEDKKLNVVATDLETVMRVQMEVESKANGRVCIPAKILMDSLKNIADQPLTFTIDKNFAVEITSDNGKYKVMGENPDNFPKKNIQPPISIKKRVLNTQKIQFFYKLYEYFQIGFILFLFFLFNKKIL